MNKPSLLKPLRVWILSAIFSLWCVLGDSFQKSGSTKWLFQNPGDTALRFVIRLLIAFLLIRVLVYLMQRPRKPRAQSFGRLRLIFAAMMLVCWLPYIIAVWPGTVSNDSIGQLRALSGLEELRPDNPLFQTGLIGAFRKFGLLFGNTDIGLASYCLVQTLLAVLLLSAVCAEVWLAVSLPIAVAVLLYHLFNPILPCFCMCVGKDTNFALAVTWLMLLLYRRFTGKERSTLKLCAAAALCVLLRNAGIGLCLAVLICLLIFEWLRQKDGGITFRSIPVAPAAGIVVCAVLWVSIHSILIPALKIPSMKKQESFSLPLQQIARVAATDGLTGEETGLLSGVLPETGKLAELYNPVLSDPVKDLWNDASGSEAEKRFFKAWLRIIRRCPSTALSAAFHQCYGYLYPGYLHPTKPSLLAGNQYGSYNALEGENAFTVNPNGDRLKSGFNALLRSCPAVRLLLAPGMYGWIAVIAFVLCFRRKRPPLWLAVLPAALVLLGNLFSPVNGYFRYAMPLYMSIGVSALCCARTLSPEKEEIQK